MDSLYSIVRMCLDWSKSPLNKTWSKCETSPWLPHLVIILLATHYYLIITQSCELWGFTFLLENPYNCLLILGHLQRPCYKIIFHEARSSILKISTSLRCTKSLHSRYEIESIEIWIALVFTFTSTILPILILETVNFLKNSQHKYVY